MNKPTDVEVVGAALYFLPIRTRVPLKFGSETVTSVTCARARLELRDGQGRCAQGWGETPLSVTWVWPSELAYETRHQILKDFCLRLAQAWLNFNARGHPLEIGWDFIEEQLPQLWRESNTGRAEQMPWLAALVCASVFDQALHDAFGVLHQIPIYQTYNAQWMSRDLSAFLEPATGEPVSFKKKYPEDFLRSSRKESLPAWHLVGGLDPLEPANLTGKEPNDGYPVLLRDWIRRDGLECLKVKLRGNDAEWDYERLVRVGEIGLQEGAKWFTADFNCTVIDPAYVNGVLDRLRKEHSEIWQKTLYVEQPFPYELEELRLDVHSVSQRKPLFLDESAHDWRMIRLGRELGWTGVALKTCKTQTGAILSACWARAHGMDLMVQDLTNPMLAQIPHLLLAAHVDTIMGVETNAMQFYPETSAVEAKVHPGIYQRRNGQVNLSSIRGPGFGYRVDEIPRALPEPVFAESH